MSGKTATPTFDFTKADRRALRYCTYCPRLCRFACPVAHSEGRETVTPWGKMRLLYLLDQGTVDVDQAVVEPLFHCISCGRCQTFCRHDISPASVLAKGRAQLVAAGYDPPAGFLDRPKSASYSWQADRSEGAAFLPARFHFESPNGAAKLEKAMVALNELGRAICIPDDCFDGHGFFEWELGQHEQAQQRWQRIDELGGRYTELISDCGPSLWAISQAPEQIKHPVSHLVEWLDDRLDLLPRGRLDGEIAVHDSCFSSRQLGLKAELRRVVEHLTGTTPGDLFESGDQARCCGAEGSWARVFSEQQKRAAQSVVNDIADSGASIVVTASPTCQASLQNQLGDDVEVLDLLDLVIRITGSH